MFRQVLWVLSVLLWLGSWLFLVASVIFFYIALEKKQSTSGLFVVMIAAYVWVMVYSVFQVQWTQSVERFFYLRTFNSVQKVRLCNIRCEPQYRLMKPALPNPKLYMSGYVYRRFDELLYALDMDVYTATIEHTTRSPEFQFEHYVVTGTVDDLNHLSICFTSQIPVDESTEIPIRLKQDPKDGTILDYVVL